MNTHDDNDALPGEDELKALYRSLPRKEPPAALDAAIKRAAADAVRGPQRRAHRWPVTVASMAVVAVVASLGWRATREPSSVPQIPSAPVALDAPAPAKAPAATMAAKASSAAMNGGTPEKKTESFAGAPDARVQDGVDMSRAKQVSTASPAKQAAAEDAIVPPQVLPPKVAKPSPPKVIEAPMAGVRYSAAPPPPPPAPMAVASAPVVPPPAPPPAVEEASNNAVPVPMAPAPAIMAPAPAPPAPPAPPAMAAPEQSIVPAPATAARSMANREMAQRSQPFPAQPAPMPANDPTRFDPADTPTQEWDKIRLLLSQQRHDEAVQRMEQFQRLHPDIALPDDLRAQLPAHE